MCLVLWADRVHPRYKLVIAANRDEFYSRPARPANFWPENPSLLAGVDLKEGGTWMGITTSGRFAVLTNYRDPANFKPHSPSRGLLMRDILESDKEPQCYMQDLIQNGGRYNGFNLLAGDVQNLYYFSNREGKVRRVDKGIHGLSNDLLDVPWPKVVRGTKALAACLKEEEVVVERLMGIMADSHQPTDDELPHTGVSLEMERMLAPLFIESHGLGYGTRTTTVILIDNSNKVWFSERTHLPDRSGQWSEVSHEFQIG